MTTSACVAQSSFERPTTPLPTSSAMPCARAASRDPMMTRCPESASLRASPRPCSPVPPSTPTVSCETSRCCCASLCAAVESVVIASDHARDAKSASALLKTNRHDCSCECVCTRDLCNALSEFSLKDIARDAKSDYTGGTVAVAKKAVKKAPARKTAAKKAVKKAPARKTAVKRVAKKAPARKAAR